MTSPARTPNKMTDMTGAASRYNNPSGPTVIIVHTAALNSMTR